MLPIYHSRFVCIPPAYVVLINGPNLKNNTLLDHRTLYSYNRLNYMTHILVDQIMTHVRFKLDCSTHRLLGFRIRISSCFVSKLSGTELFFSYLINEIETECYVLYPSYCTA